VNRRCHTLLAPLIAVLALLLGLAGVASAAFNAAATDPHYGIFLPQLSEAPARMPLEIADPTRENGVWLYDSTLGVPVYVKQNPWTSFDPEGLAEFLVGNLKVTLFQNGVMGSVCYATDSDRASVSHLSTQMSEAGKERASYFKASPGRFLKEAVQGYRSGTGDTPASSFGSNVAEKEAFAALLSRMPKVGGRITPGPALATPNGVVVPVSGGLATTTPAPLPVGALLQSNQESKPGDSARDTSDSNPAKKPTGSYTNEHASGTKYHGKGPEKRMNESAKEKATEYDDPVVKQDFKPAANDREALKDEARRIREDGGVKDNPNNYNKRNSPGEKYLKQDGE
jgi:hypothetical protein